MMGICHQSGPAMRDRQGRILGAPAEHVNAIAADTDIIAADRFATNYLLPRLVGGWECEEFASGLIDPTGWAMRERVVITALLTFLGNIRKVDAGIRLDIEQIEALYRLLCVAATTS